MHKLSAVKCSVLTNWDDNTKGCRFSPIWRAFTPALQFVIHLPPTTICWMAVANQSFGLPKGSYVHSRLSIDKIIIGVFKDYIQALDYSKNNQHNTDILFMRSAHHFHFNQTKCLKNTSEMTNTMSITAVVQHCQLTVIIYLSAILKALSLELD